MTENEMNAPATINRAAHCAVHGEGAKVLKTTKRWECPQCGDEIDQLRAAQSPPLLPVARDEDAANDAKLFKRALRALHNLHGRECVCVFCERHAALASRSVPPLGSDQ